MIDQKNQWIGYSGAGEEQIAQAEARLKTRLPESYREFLKVSNGWPTGGPYVGRILPIEEIEWVSARKRDWLEGWKLGFGSDDPSVFREIMGFDLRLLEGGLEISDERDIGVYLLMPGLKSADGEWEAWCFEAEGGAMRYRSFDELMQAEYRKVKDLVDEDNANFGSQKSPDSVWNDLSSLLAEFEKEIEAQTKIANSESWELAQYEVGIRDELQCGWQRLSQIQEQTRDPEEVRHALVSLMGEFENRWHQKFLDMKQEPETKILEKMRLSATGEGARRTMGIIQWFLKEHKVL
ncbi:SMI1/KNR4 family protein [Longilinea arvoryzae]|uniref:SMI1/KNR4 family protein n=1 Tax=Longilinea arvoryzae TaxID=360412 RepID=UPI0015610251|nr:SMI1/KNR4 family protein [Longilinea arvoryzae]